MGILIAARKNIINDSGESPACFNVFAENEKQTLVERRYLDAQTDVVYAFTDRNGYFRNDGRTATGESFKQ